MFNIIFIDRFVKLKCCPSIQIPKNYYLTLYLFFLKALRKLKFPGFKLSNGELRHFHFLLFLSSITRNYFINSAAVINYLILPPHQDILPILLFSGRSDRTPSTATAACAGSPSGSRLTTSSPGSPSAPPPPS